MKLRVFGRGAPRTLEYNQPARLSSLLRESGCPAETPCGERQTCLKCRVVVTGGLTPPDERERALLGPRALAAGERFACMATATGDVEVHLPERKGAMEVLTDDAAIGAEPDPWDGVTGALGAAVDIGTTTVAASLAELATGRKLRTASARNPQAAFGADVITRIGRAMNGEGAALADSVRRCVRGLLDEMGRTDELGAVVITGNTAMLYLLCGHDPAAIAAAPFIPDHIYGEFLPPEAVGLDGLPARVYLTRCMSAYVGGDITTAVLSAGVHKAGRPELLADIGTNGELVLNVGGRLLVCSTAAGPAFEGAGIAMGLPAVPGAVSAVRFEDGAFVCSTLGGRPAAGLCGSGIVDAVAAMLDAGLIDETGLLLEDGHAFEEYMTEHDGAAAFRLPGTEVVVTQKDLRAVQLAKSAICAGMLTLLDAGGIAAADVDRVLIAGGFGSFLSIPSAARIGLVPPALAGKAAAVGNAAAAGAAMALVSKAALTESEALAARAQTVELSTSPVFMEQYVEQMMFQ